MTSRNVWISAFALTSILTFAGCQTAPPSAPTRDIAADTAALRTLSEQYAAAVNSGDAAATAATFADDGIDMAPNQAASEGKPAIQARYEAAFKGYTVKFAATPLETQLAGDWGYVRGNYTLSVSPKSGKAIEESGKYLNIVKRQPDGAWKLYRLSHNADNPPPSAAGKKK